MSKRKTTAAQRETQRFWKAHIDAWKVGRLKQSRYCRDHQLKLHQFIYWKKKFSQPIESPVSLVEISLPKLFPLHARSAALKVAVGDNLKIEVDPGFDPATLKRLIVTLGQL
jgi:hypothetical protein